MLSVYGLSKDDIYVLNKPVVFRKVFCVTPPLLLSCYASPEFIKTIRRLEHIAIDGPVFQYYCRGWWVTDA